MGADPPRIACIAHLSGFIGILRVDGYGGYRMLADKSGVTLAF